MGQEIHISMMSGGLDLITPPIVIDPGKAIGAANYEPDVNGYTSHGGFERYDGSPAPSGSSDPVEIASRRSLITMVPGVGPVRGVWCFDGFVYAFRDQANGSSGMFRAINGWQAMSFGYKLQFGSGTDEFLEGETVTDSSSGATAKIDRVVLREGVWDGTASGFLIVSNISGSFDGGAITSLSGAAVGVAPEPVALVEGGRFDFTNHNFYGARDRARMYFCNGVDTAFEWSGSVLTPIFTGISGGGAEPLNVTNLLAPEAPIAAGEFILSGPGGANIVMSAQYDSPSFISHYKNHLMLGYTSGALINSSLGEPLEYSTTTGAGEMDFGDQLTGLLTAASTALMAFAQNRIEYLTGDDSSNFNLQPITDASGAYPYTIQMMDEPMFLDDGGVHRASTTAAFGDWRMGAVTQPVEPLITKKKKDQIPAAASLRIKSKDQYKLFWEDGTGITVYVGRKQPETLPFNLPVKAYCACAGELEIGGGERLFIGCRNGFVYELNKGTSFDGDPIESYIRLPFNAAKSPAQQTRWQKATFEIASPDPITIGVAFHVDYAKGLGGDSVNVPMEAGSQIVTADLYDEVDWSQPIEGRLEYHLAGIGPNIAATLIHSSAVARQHTIQSQTYNFSRRGLKR
jgi:hypothetical protein